ncbi:MAG: hypothetical protein HC895_12160 [Leptolyngbyaceae cyanobacterium SM1_3_5]|nr:hypothetical protein [Leptolyngbyaceae cyanobacterium SM1_3_5]
MLSWAGSDRAVAQGKSALLPRFDKSLHEGAGDRIDPERVDRADVILFEGWFVGGASDRSRRHSILRLGRSKPRTIALLRGTVTIVSRTICRCGICSIR